MVLKIGDIVSVQHETKLDKSGNVYITGAAKFSETKIVRVYHSGKVQVKSGDVWELVPLGAGKWRTSSKN